MEINFSQCLMDLDGSPLEWTTVACPVCGRERESKPATLRALCADALVQGYRDARGQPEQLSGEEHVRRFSLAMRIMNEDILDISLEDATLIRELVAKRFTSLFAGQVWVMIDPKVKA